jgi:hypothetical protein
METKLKTLVMFIKSVTNYFSRWRIVNKPVVFRDYLERSVRSNRQPGWDIDHGNQIASSFYVF